MVVLLASAAVAACEKDIKKAKVATTRTYGDSTVDPIVIDSVESDDEQYGAAPSPLRGVLGSPSYTNNVTTRPTPGLPAPLDSMRDSALVGYLNSLKYDGSHHNTDLKYVSCKTSSGPCAANDSIGMFIQPEIGIRHMPHDSVPLYGMVVARIINYGTDTAKHDIRFAVPGHTRAWWVVEKVGATFRSRLFVRTYAAMPAVRILVGRDGETHDYNQCPQHPALPPKSRPSKAKWATCATDTLYLSGVAPVPQRGLKEFERYVHLASFPPAPDPRPTSVALDGGWGTCDQWCCSTQ